MKKKNNKSELSRINELARAEGLSYGKYVAKHETSKLIRFQLKK